MSLFIFWCADTMIIKLINSSGSPTVPTTNTRYQYRYSYMYEFLPNRPGQGTKCRVVIIGEVYDQHSGVSQLATGLDLILFRPSNADVLLAIGQLPAELHLYLWNLWLWSH